MYSHMVAARLRAVTSSPVLIAKRLQELDKIVLTPAALCVRSSTPDDWYPITKLADRYAAAAAIQCEGCPFTFSGDLGGDLGPCLERTLLMEHGRPRHQVDGIAAGTTPEERIAIRSAAPEPAEGVELVEDAEAVAA
ncbi:hypothetical protein [Streptosporangium sp. OZ121]|uniref:hypothetical protein n=1 Tax=Streptosporangium sp. OZ121 TaxID=3444183 RepID=UPI003F7AE912